MTAPIDLGRTYDTVQLRVLPAVPRQEPEPQAPPGRKGGRDRYFDLLRALALGRVVLYHNFGWFWLPSSSRRWA